MATVEMNWVLLQRRIRKKHRYRVTLQKTPGGTQVLAKIPLHILMHQAPHMEVDIMFPAGIPTKAWYRAHIPVTMLTTGMEEDDDLRQCASRHFIRSLNAAFLTLASLRLPEETIYHIFQFLVNSQHKRPMPATESFANNISYTPSPAPPPVVRLKKKVRRSLVVGDDV